MERRIHTERHATPPLFTLLRQPHSERPFLSLSLPLGIDCQLISVEARASKGQKTPRGGFHGNQLIST